MLRKEENKAHRRSKGSEEKCKNREQTGNQQLATGDNTVKQANPLLNRKEETSGKAKEEVKLLSKQSELENEPQERNEKLPFKHHKHHSHHRLGGCSTGHLTNNRDLMEECYKRKQEVCRDLYFLTSRRNI